MEAHTNSAPQIQQARREQFRGGGPEFIENLRGAGVLRPGGNAYRNWLLDFAAKGNKPTHVYDYPQSRVEEELFVATRDFELEPRYGSSAVNIVVPAGVTVSTPNGLGHNNLYLADGTSRGGWIPAYSDTKIPGIDEALQTERARSEQLHSKSLQSMREHRRLGGEIENLRGAGVLRPGGNAYRNWLLDFAAKGNKPTHVYDYPQSRVEEELFVATRDFELEPRYGSSAVNIVVPAGVTVSTPNGLGHNNLYLADGTSRGGWIPAYSDTKIPGIDEARQEQARRSLALGRYPLRPLSEQTRPGSRYGGLSR